MGSLPPPELSLDIRPAFVPKTIGDFLREVAAISDPSCRSSRLEDLVNSLEGEMKKIDAFKRELPLSMLLLHDAIITLKLELVQCTAPSTQPVLAELMPLTKGIDEIEKEGHEENEGGAKDKMNWKSCLQLWTSSYNNSSAVQPVDPKQDVKAQTKGLEFSKYRTEAEDVPVKTCSSSRSGVNNFMPLRGGFSPSVFPSKEDKVELPVHGLSLLTTGCKAAKEEQPVSGDVKNNCSRSIFQNLRSSQQQSSRKQRRCWSPELHRRFVNALQQLGGSQVATPKQIRELMQIDGLTNDEVKSHLQKYRLHTRKHPSSSSAINDSKSSLALGGLWSSSQNKTESSFSKENDSSGSPEGPLQLCTTTIASAGAASATGGESMEDDEEEDTTKSESYSWKNQIHRPRKVSI